MALDLEEQEQVAELKAWWQQHGRLITAVIVAAALGFSGWQGWRLYQQSQAANAAGLYDTLARAAEAGDGKAMRDAGGTLIESYPRTLYASMGALVAARFHFDRNDLKSAKVQLQWVLDHTPSEEMRDLARLRLAAVLLDEPHRLLDEGGYQSRLAPQPGLELRALGQQPHRAARFETLYQGCCNSANPFLQAQQKT